MYSSNRRTYLLIGLICGLSAGLLAEDVPAVTIYRDWDDGLFGRSLYRDLRFSVNVDAFSRYRSLEVSSAMDQDFRDSLPGVLTAVTFSAERIQSLSDSPLEGFSFIPWEFGPGDGSIEDRRFRYRADGIDIEFVLERVPEPLLVEIDRTYPNNLDTADLVKTYYQENYIIRILTAENVYRPEFADIDYEDALISATLLGDSFQPLWGIHDGLALPESQS